MEHAKSVPWKTDAYLYMERMKMEAGCIMGALSLLALVDYKIKKIPVVPLILTGILGMILHIIYGGREIEDILFGIAIGIVLYIVSEISKGKIGKGDAFLFMVTGVYLGFWNNLVLLWAASVMAGVVGVFVILSRKKRMDYKMPFVPFVLAAAFVMLIVGGGKFA